MTRNFLKTENAISYAYSLTEQPKYFCLSELLKFWRNLLSYSKIDLHSLRSKSLSLDKRNHFQITTKITLIWRWMSLWISKNKTVFKFLKNKCYLHDITWWLIGRQISGKMMGDSKNWKVLYPYSLKFYNSDNSFFTFPQFYYYLLLQKAKKLTKLLSLSRICWVGWA